MKPSRQMPEFDDYDPTDDGQCFMCGGSGELDECGCSAFEDVGIPIRQPVVALNATRGRGQSLGRSPGWMRPQSVKARRHASPAPTPPLAGWFGSSDHRCSGLLVCVHRSTVGVGVA